MNKLDFYKEFGNIDEELIIEADSVYKRKAHSVKPVLAASLLIVMLSIAALISRGSTPIIISPSTSATEFSGEPFTNKSTEPSTSTNTEPTNIIYNKTDKMVGSLINIPGHFWQTLSDKEKLSVFGNIANKYSLDATANFSKTDEAVDLFDITATVKLSNTLSINFTVSDEPIYTCYILDKEQQKKTVVNGVDVIFGVYKTDSLPQKTFFAEFTVDGIYYSAEMTTEAESEKLFSDFISFLTLCDKPDLSAITPVVPELRDDILSLEGAYADSSFGIFIPKNIPLGYSFESARRFINQDYNYLSVLWCKGLHDIRFQVGYITDYEKNNITSVDELKNYDLSLYPIPRGESVPEELWEIVQEPVFKAEELSEEVIARRVTEHYEDGKITKKIDFSVLFENDIVLSVSTSDIEPDELYNMIFEIMQNNA